MWLNIKPNYYIRSQLTKSRKRAVTKINRQLIRPSRKYPWYHELRSPTWQLYSFARGSFLLIFLHFHSILCLIDHHKKSISLVRKPESFLRIWFSRSCADDDWQRLKFQNTTEHWKVFISHQKLDKPLVSTFEGQTFLTIKRYFTKS